VTSEKKKAMESVRNHLANELIKARDEVRHGKYELKALVMKQTIAKRKLGQLQQIINQLNEAITPKAAKSVEVKS
jgi:hypothetical protein